MNRLAETVAATGGRVPAYTGPTYYGRATVKPPPWDPLVPVYVFLGGTAGGAAVIGAAARVALGEEGRGLAKAANLIGTGAAILGAPLLIEDLKTPSRWYNMLRIFRATSPMSIGSYVLTGFGAFTSAGALADLAGDGRPGIGETSFGETSWSRLAADALRAPAAVTGALLATYTAGLLSATSVPLWASEPRLLAARYGASAMASGAAALSLAEQAMGRPDTARRLDAVSALAGAAALGITLASDEQLHRRRLDGPYRGTRAGTMHRAALALGALAPVLHGASLLGRRPSPALSIAGSLAMLASSYLTRASVMRAAVPATERPQDYLGFTQPEILPDGEPRPRLPRRFPPATRPAEGGVRWR